MTSKILVILASCWLLLACNAGRTPATDASAPSTQTEQAALCDGSMERDYSASSLPRKFTPRPGPDLLYAQPPRAPQLENSGFWQAPPILISGASAYRCGEFLYQDWLFDDRGAAGLSDPSDPHDASGFLFSPKAGTLTYPSDAAYANNAADLVEFRVRPLAAATAFRISLNSLSDPSLVAFTIALGDSAAAVDWPYSAGVRSPAQFFLSVKGLEVELLDASNNLQAIAGPTLELDEERRQYTIVVPNSAWNPGTDTVRITAGIGLWDATAASYLQTALITGNNTPGGGVANGAALYNVAFRASEPTPDFTVFSGRTIVDAAVLARTQAHWWRERLQADALQAGDISGFFAQVDFAKLQRGERDESAVPQSGFMNRIFASRFTYGQGLDYLADCGGTSAARPCQGMMRGQLLPYAIYVPEQTAPADGYGLTVFPHALSANYNQYLGSRHARDLGERGSGSIVITASARGPDGFYYDTSQADVFEVWADAARHYPLDPDRVVMSGISMGGIGSFRIATRFPDLFARIMPVVATASGSEDALPSLRNVPVMMWTAAFDELQPLVLTEGTISELFDLGYQLDSYRFNSWDHLSPSTNDYYAPGTAFLLNDQIQRNPVRVSYVLRPGEDSPETGLVADHAYWLSALSLRDSSINIGRIDAISEGLGQSESIALDVTETNGIYEGGYHEPAPYTQRLLDWAEPTDMPAANRLRIVASNIATVTVDPARAGLSCGAEIDIESDGPLEVILQGC